MTTATVIEPNIQVRFATSGDTLYLKQNDKAISSAVLEKKLFDKEILIATLDSKKAAWLRFNLFQDHLPCVNMMGVDSDLRRRGLGTKLLLHWEGLMRGEGYRRVMASALSNERGQFFYRKLGYQDCGGLLLPQEPMELVFIKKLVEPKTAAKETK